MNIVIATYMDWDAIYIDGICEKEDHTLCVGDLAHVLRNDLPCSIESMEVKSVDEKWWYEEDRDSYPQNIEDVVFEKEK